METEYLNIGSSGCKMKGCLNVDIDTSSVLKSVEFHQDVVGNILFLPFKNESFKGVIAHHVFEHLKKEHHNFAIRECRRVIIPGGRISFEVPDFPVIFQNYIDNFEGARERWETYIFGRGLWNGDIHRSSLTHQEITNLMFRNGFGNLKWYGNKEGRHFPVVRVIATKNEEQEWSISHGNNSSNRIRHIDTP